MLLASFGVTQTTESQPGFRFGAARASLRHAQRVFPFGLRRRSPASGSSVSAFLRMSIRFPMRIWSCAYLNCPGTLGPVPRPPSMPQRPLGKSNAPSVRAKVDGGISA